eukprot:13974-Heterococcus_DN1.PRE.1
MVNHSTQLDATSVQSCYSATAVRQARCAQDVALTAAGNDYEHPYYENGVQLSYSSSLPP